MPRYLYRYRPLDENGRTLDILQSNRMYMCQPDEFNDPFDCRLPFSFDHNVPDRIAELSRGRDYINKQAGKDVFKLTNSALPDNAALYLKETYDQHQQRILKSIRLLCFSAVRNNILLWSHYGAGHTGVCLRFRIREDGPFASVCKVHYSTECPKLDFYRDSPEAVQEKTLFHKSRKWSYEKEWRIVTEDKEDRYLKFPEADLVGIVLGCSMKPEDRDTVLNLLSKRVSPITVYDAKPERYKFGLRIEAMMKLG